jgi:hypothetical protein
MNKSNAALVFLVMMLGGSTLYFQRQHQSALLHIERLQQDHATRIAKLTENYQADIGNLEQYILNQYRREPGITRGERPPARLDLDQAPADPVERKYRYLLDDIADAATGERLRHLLLERESTAAQAGSPDYETRLAEIDVRIGELLDAADYQKYSALKKSDTEQHHLNVYARGISQLAPLSAEQHQALLFAKLRHKKVLEAALGDSGMQQERLSRTEREYAHTAIRQALREYKSGYLEEAGQLLDEEQFALLNNYETTEFELELERLQAQINAKM